MIKQYLTGDPPTTFDEASTYAIEILMVIEDVEERRHLALQIVNKAIAVADPLNGLALLDEARRTYKAFLKEYERQSDMLYEKVN